MLIVDVTNAGPATAAETVIVLSSDGTRLLQTSGCAEDPAGFPTCTLGDLGMGISAQVTLLATVEASPSMLGGGGPNQVVHNFSLSATTLDLEPADNNATVLTSVDATPPRVTAQGAMLGNGSLRDIEACDPIREPFDSMEVFLSELVIDPPGDTEVVDVTNSQSWRLVTAGDDGILEASTCDSLLGDDVSVVPTRVMFNGGTHGFLQWPSPLVAGRHRLLACAAGLADLVGLHLDGVPGGDHAVEFRVDPGNLFQNGALDCSLDRWFSEGGSGSAQLVHIAVDADNDPGSGSAHYQGFSAGQALQLAQCIRTPEIRTLDWSTAARLDFASGDILDVAFTCHFLEDGDCEGSLAGTQQSAFKVELAGWTDFGGRMTPPFGARSAICGFVTRPGDSQFYGLFLDSLRLESLPIFVDGFESGDTSTWSGTVP